MHFVVKASTLSQTFCRVFKKRLDSGSAELSTMTPNFQNGHHRLFGVFMSSNLYISCDDLFSVYSQVFSRGQIFYTKYYSVYGIMMYLMPMPGLSRSGN